MKIRIIIVITAVVVVGAMIVEWKFASRMGAGVAIHNYHGICNCGVGEPYQDFIHRLRLMAEGGDTNRLVTALRRADEHSRDIYDVWLGAYPGGAIDTDVYRKSVDEILK
jgi:hypothetical protein